MWHHIDRMPDDHHPLMPRRENPSESICCQTAPSSITASPKSVARITALRSSAAFSGLSSSQGI
jgi:hypothetical protein